MLLYIAAYFRYILIDHVTYTLAQIVNLSNNTALFEKSTYYRPANLINKFIEVGFRNESCSCIQEQFNLTDFLVHILHEFNDEINQFPGSH